MLDMDVQGREATKKIAEILPYGKCKIANLAGAKDANEALTSGMAGAIASAIFEAKSHRLRQHCSRPISDRQFTRKNSCSLPYLINS